MKIVLCTGGYDPLHSGHIEYFKEAKKLGHKLVVGVNSDAWLTRKKGRPFMSFFERTNLIKNLSMVDDVIGFNDDDGTACHAVFHLLSTHGPSDTIVVANGGDRHEGNIPEYKMYKNTYGVEFAWGVGGNDQKNSSNLLLDDWKAPKTLRTWGYYRVLHEVGKETKVKELTVDPGKKLSMQRHQKRSEHWFVAEGIATVYTLNVKTDIEEYGTYEKHQSLHIPVGMWHQLANETDEPLKLIEIQYGKDCVEEDIERRD